MKPLKIADSPTIILGLQDEIRRSEESRYDHRLHGLLLVAQGMTCPEVARLLGDAPRSVEYWVGRFERDGLAGLLEGERPGRPRRLAEKQMEAVDRILRQPPREAGLSGNIWDGKNSALGLSRNTTSTSGYASASVCSVNSASACVNRDLRWLRPIPNFRKPIKKTPRLDAGCQRGSLGNRRSALSTAWLALPHVDPARNQGPRPTPCPDPQECGVFRGRALAGWAVCVQSGNRQI